MTELFRDPDAAWVGLLIVLLPLAIIGAGELEERLHRRDSTLASAVSIVRVWVAPLFALWVLVVTLFEVDRDHPIVRLIFTALVLAIVAVALRTVQAITAGLGEQRRREGRRAVPRLVLALPRFAVIVAAVWILVDSVWAFDLSRAATALGVGSLVISFALQGPLGGLASGFLLLADRPFQPGDWVQAGDIEGRVVDMNWRSSRIHDRDGDLVIVPNSALALATIINYDEPTRLHRVVVELQVAFINPPTLAKEMLLEAARATPNVLQDPAPVARVVQIDDPLMGYEVHLWVDDYTIAPHVKAAFGSLVWYHSHRLGVPLPSPAQDLYLYDGVQSGIDARLDRTQLDERLGCSPLLDRLEPDERGSLAESATGERFAAGEVIVVEGARRDLHLLFRGTARLVIRRPNVPTDVPVLDLGPGDLFGVVDGATSVGFDRLVVATSDCEVVKLSAATAGSVVSRNPTLAGALEQMEATRRRRIERALRLHAKQSSAGSADLATDAAVDGTSPGEPW